MKQFKSSVVFGSGRLRAGAALSGIAISLAMAGAASAQEADAEGDYSAKEDIVVTGTLIRGTEAIGSQTLAVDNEAIIQQGANSTNEVLALIPQVANAFNGRFEGDPRGIGAGISINRPNLRALPSFNSASGGVTLVLMDGFRLTPIGVNQSAVDVDIIPAAVLAGVDALTDGGSSLYGADAVAGVINFRTMKSFEGIKVDANYGFGTTISGFDQWDGTITAGTSWSNGNAYISVGHTRRDGIRNGETDWATGEIYDVDGNASFTGAQCLNPVGSEIRYFKFGTNDTDWTNNPLAPGAGTFPIGEACDTFSSQTYLPKQKRTNVFASLSQEVADNIDLRVTAYWTKRDTTLFQYPRGYTTPAQTPVFPTGASPGTIYSVLGGTGFSFGANSAYEEANDRLGFETWGVTPELTVDLGGDWSMRTTMHYGRSTNYQRFSGVNNTLAQSYVDSGDLDPLDVASASAAVVTDILDYENAQQTKQELFAIRTVVDGPIFELPGGDAKIAVGLEYQTPSVELRLTNDRVGVLETLPYRRAERNSKAAFAELSLPILDFVDVAASLRHDDYSDFGSTTNPNIGLSIRPVEWLKVFGHWNKSFNAPTALDNLAVAVGRTVCGIYSPASGPYDPLGKWDGTGTCAFLAEGATPGLKPQTAESWAVGFEANPLDGLRFGAQFYSIDFKNILGAVNPTNLATYELNEDLYIYNPSAAFWSDFLSVLSNGDAISQQVTNTDIALLVDRRTTNLNQAKLEGVDFHINYVTESDIGQLSFGINGTKQTKSDLTSGGIKSNNLGLGGAELTASIFAGWSKGRVTSKLTINYSGKFRDSGVNYLGEVETVDPFVQTNLFLGYDFGESGGALEGTSFRLTVDNIFEEKPQRIRRGSGNILTYNNWTLGRVIKLGVSKRF